MGRMNDFSLEQEEEILNKLSGVTQEELDEAKNLKTIMNEYFEEFGPQGYDPAIRRAMETIEYLRFALSDVSLDFKFNGSLFKSITSDIDKDLDKVDLLNDLESSVNSLCNLKSALKVLEDDGRYPEVIDLGKNLSDTIVEYCIPFDKLVMVKKQLNEPWSEADMNKFNDKIERAVNQLSAEVVHNLSQLNTISIGHEIEQIKKARKKDGYKGNEAFLDYSSKIKYGFGLNDDDLGDYLFKEKSFIMENKEKEISGYSYSLSHRVQKAYDELSDYLKEANIPNDFKLRDSVKELMLGENKLGKGLYKSDSRDIFDFDSYDLDGENDGLDTDNYEREV